jgi:Caspase domain
MRVAGGVSARNAPLFFPNRVLPTVKTTKAPLAGGLVLLVALGLFCSDPKATRSVTPLRLADTPAAPKFSRAASTGLFVGVRKFPHDETLEVPYAVDDAVDLAYRFVLDQRVALIPPLRVVLALSGTPQKNESKERLQELEHAGARIVRDAASGEILDLLKQQAALAGNEGLFVLSIASHGFQQNGDAYILGSTSEFGSPETALRAATIYDIAAQAKRSLIFIDACRDRIGKDSRSAAADPAAAAPHIRRMKNVQGQVIFYAAAPGQYAFDDHVRRNGVFTKAVLDGLNGEASAPRGTVTVETLHNYVDRAVRRWIFENKKRMVNPATQISMEGETRNMALCDCWRTPGPKIRVAVDRSIVTAYAEDTRRLFRHDLGEPIVHTEVADLDADALYEVVVGLRDRIIVFDREGKERWTIKESKALRTFTTGDLFEKHTNQIVALWNDGKSSSLTVLDSDGGERSRFDFAGQLGRVAIGRPTNMHAPKIVVTTNNSLLLFHPRKLTRGIPVWRQMLRSADAIESLQILDGNRDLRRDIAVATTHGTTWFTFDGKIVKQNGREKWQKGRGR